MKPIPIPARYNYVAAFLTLSCNLRCSYCINDFGGERRPTGRLLSAADWVRGLNRLVVRPDLPVTIQGGEPSLHPGFFEILRGVKADINLDILTNLTFDPERLIAEVRPERLRRDAPYASIRVSYHPETMALEPLMEKVLRLQGAGFSIGIWGVLHPRQQEKVLRAQGRCREAGIDFRTKEFLGEHEGRLHGRFLYPGACDGEPGREVLCRTSELLVGPGGEVFRCHSDLYAGRSPIGRILDPVFAVEDGFLPCREFGHCNPCDIKVKTNRFQEFGHTSVEISGLDSGQDAPSQRGVR
jgi:hypothetical protein